MKPSFSVFGAVVCAAAVVLGFLHFKAARDGRLRQEAAEVKVQSTISQEAQACAEQFKDQSSASELPVSIRQQALDVRSKYNDLFSKLAARAKNALVTRDFVAAEKDENELIAEIEGCGMDADFAARKVGFDRGEYDEAELKIAQEFNEKVISITAPNIHR